MVAKRTRRKIDPELALRILRTVPMPNAFLFFTDEGQYTGKSASSLADFLEKLNKIPLKSLEFHFGRRDFEKWVEGTLGDEYLADRITRIERTIQGENIRKTLQKTVKNRLNQLKTAQKTKT